VAPGQDQAWLFGDEPWQARMQGVAARLNDALARDDHRLAAEAMADLFAGLEERRAVDPQTAELAIKGARNELVRLFMLHGWHQEAEAVARQALQGLAIDRFCPNRDAVLHQALARILFTTGRLDEAQAELDQAIGLTRRFLAAEREAWRRFPDAGVPRGPDRPGGPPPAR
jgi:tetratricopeptide (TPR) repeat protein